MKLSVGVFTAKHAKHVIARAIACSVLMVLPSCQIPRLYKAEQAPGLPTEFNLSANPEYAAPLAAVIGGLGVANIANRPPTPENSAQLRVDEFYDDPILTHLLCQALAGNRELKIMEQEIQIARNEILSRRGAYLPMLGFHTAAEMKRYSKYTLEGASRQDDPFVPGRLLPNPLANFPIGFNLFWQLDIWRELRNARDAAIQRYAAAIEKRNYFVTRLVAEIAENYYGLMALDKRLENLDRIIEFQLQSYEAAKARFEAGRSTELPVQRFQAEVRKNQSEKLIVRQEIIEVENRINFLVNRFPQAVERSSTAFLDLNIHALNVGVPSQLLQNRPDIRQAERELVAAGLEVKVARAHFFPRIDIMAGIGYEAFNPRYLFNPEALVANAVGDLTAPVINRAAIRADYLTANAKQLEAVYNYQRVILNAFTEVINRLNMVEYYRRSIDIKQQQLAALEASVEISTKLFLAARVEYIEVLFAQRDLLDARMVVIDTKRQQLTAIVNTYQALGGGAVMVCPPPLQPVAGGPEPMRPPEVQQLPPPRPGVMP